MNQDKKPDTILLRLATSVCEFQICSPTFWLPRLLCKLSATPSKYLSQNITDIYIILRFIMATFIAIYYIRFPYMYWIIIALLVEMTLAYLSHYLTDKFNSAGPGKVTSVRRTIIILSINYFTYILIFSTLYQKYNNLDLIDATYLSTITMTTLGYGDVLPKNSISKVLTCLEVTIGIFQMAIYFGSISGWSKIRQEINVDDNKRS